MPSSSEGPEYDEEERAKFEGMGIQFHDGLPIFPFVPDAVKERRFVVIEAGDLPDDAEVQRLILRMWEEPETAYYYYHGHSGGPGPDVALMRAKNRGDVLMDERERRHYKHPRYKRDYVRIVPTGEDEYRWDWEREVVRKGPEFWRVTLALSQRKRDELDAWRKVQMEEHFRQQARHAKYAYDVFLSHSTPDSEEAQRIGEKIVAAGHRVFLAPKELRPGDDFAEEIRLALLGSRELWLLVSPSTSNSEWVISEWGAAWALGKRIVPILHRCAPDSLPARLAKLQCIDMHRVDEVIRLLAVDTVEVRVKMPGGLPVTRKDGTVEPR
jgi:hypothetical protein